MNWEQQARHALQDIYALGYDYDGFTKVDDLKGLIDDLVIIARQAQKGEYNYNENFWGAIEEYRMAKKSVAEDRGYAFKTDTGQWFLLRCPKCHKENWAMSVSSGVCAWCGFDMNKDTQDAETNS